MWIARIQFPGDKALFGSRCKRHGISVSGYPLSTYCTKDGVYLFAAFFVFGDQQKIRTFIADLKKDKRLLSIEENANYMMCQIREPIKHNTAYKHDIFHVKPLTIDNTGLETWTLGSWNKKSLTDFADLVEMDHQGRLLSISKEKISNVSVISVHPCLTDQQKKALELAIKKGYYEYPRRTDLQELASLSKLSYATFHAHLRKAEQRLLPFLFNKNQDLEPCILPKGGD